jgi:SAM-dependent methyltransferase
MTPVPPNVVKHPAVFPEQIPWRLINLLTIPGDVVLDPMCGSGQTLKTAKSLGRKYIGVDLRKEYVELSRKRLLEKPMLSNFMIPLYFPVRWFNGEQHGGKDHAHLDVEDHIPKGFRLLSQNSYVEKEYGTKTLCLYYKNNSGEFACCVIGAKQDPFIINVGNPLKKASKINRLFHALPQKFSKHDISSLSSEYLGKELLAENAVADLLVLSGLAKPTSKSNRSQEYAKMHSNLTL